MTTERKQQITSALLKDGISFALVSSMTNDELEQSMTCEDYTEYNNFMNYLARKIRYLTAALSAA